MLPALESQAMEPVPGCHPTPLHLPSAATFKETLVATFLFDFVLEN